VDPVTGTQTALKPLFDLKISAQKATEYTKMAQNELALQLYQLGMFAPNNADPALATLEMMDFDGKDSVMQRIQQNMMMFQMLQQAQAENAMLKSMLGMGGAESGAPGAPAPTGAPGGASAAPARLPQADGAQGGISQRNQITDKARARAQAATQPG
jgi:hypothetical protein